MFKAEVTIVAAIVLLLVLFNGCSDIKLIPELPSKESAGNINIASSSPASVTVTPKPSPLADAERRAEQLDPTAQAQRPNDDTVETAMAGLVDALQQRDTKGFLTFVSDKASLRYLLTVDKPYRTEIVRYSDLVRDLMAKETDGGWYVRLFDAGPDGAFSYFADKSVGRSWKRVAENKFVPPDASADSSVFVTWRKHEGRWVVQSIGDPDA